MTFSGAADTPVFSVPDGTYTSVQTVAITDATQGAAIYFTTDGTPPTTGSSVYNQPITVSETETLEAIAVATGYTQSAVATAVYTIDLPVTPSVTITPSTSSVSGIRFPQAQPGIQVPSLGYRPVQGNEKKTLVSLYARSPVLYHRSPLIWTNRKRLFSSSSR